MSLPGVQLVRRRREALTEARLALQAADAAHDKARECPECMGLTPLHDHCGTCGESVRTHRRRVARIQAAQTSLRIRMQELLDALGELPPLPTLEAVRRHKEQAR